MPVKLSLLITQERADLVVFEGSPKKFKIHEVHSVERNHLLELLKNYKKAESIRISLDLDDIVLEQYSFPPAKGGILKALVKRELGTVLQTEYQFDFEIMEEYREGENIRRRVFAAAIPHHILEGIAREIEIPLDFITVYPASIRALLKDENLLRGRIAFIELREDGIEITIFKDESIRIVRKLPPYEGDTGALSRDILQTLFFHKQIYQGESVERVILSGRKLDEETVEVLSKDLEIGVEVLEDIKREYPAPLGGIFLTKQDKFTFLPPTVKKRRYIRYANAVIASILFIALVFQIFRISSLTGELRGAESYAKGLKEFIQSKEEELLSMRKELIEYQVKLAEPSFDRVLLEMASLIPEGVKITEFKISKNGEYMIEAKGTVEEGPPVQRLAILNEIMERMKLSPLLLDPVLNFERENAELIFELKAGLPAKRSLK